MRFHSTVWVVGATPLAARVDALAGGGTGLIGLLGSCFQVVLALKRWQRAGERSWRLKMKCWLDGFDVFLTWRVDCCAEL
jgi:hypothetical protein